VVDKGREFVADYSLSRVHTLFPRVRIRYTETANSDSNGIVERFNSSILHGLRIRRYFEQKWSENAAVHLQLVVDEVARLMMMRYEGAAAAMARYPLPVHSNAILAHAEEPSRPSTTYRVGDRVTYRHPKFSGEPSPPGTKLHTQVVHATITRVLSDHMYMIKLDQPFEGSKVVVCKAHHRYLVREGLPCLTEPVYDLEELAQRSMQHSSSSSHVPAAASHSQRPREPVGMGSNAAPSPSLSRGSDSASAPVRQSDRVGENVSASRVSSSALQPPDKAAASQGAPQVDNRDSRLSSLVNLHVSVGDIWVVNAYVDSVAATEPSIIEVTGIQADGMVDGAFLVRCAAQPLVPAMRQVDDMRLPTCTIARVWQQGDNTWKPVCPNPTAPAPPPFLRALFSPEQFSHRVRV
jgi:hypothetical protein